MFDEVTKLPEGWTITNLGELGEWSSGGTPSRTHAEYYGGDIPWVKTGNLPDALITEIDECITLEGLTNSSAKLFPSRSLIVAMYGATIGKLGILKEPAATNQACAALLSKGVTAEVISYLFYYLLSSRENLKRIGQGGAQPNISQAILKDYPCPLAPLNEQRRIVAKIEALKARSQQVKEALEAIPPLLDQFRQSVLAAAFRGDLTADWREKNPDVEPASVLLERICVERRRRWEEAELEKMEAQGKTPTDDKWKLKYKEPELVNTVNLLELPGNWHWTKFETVATIASNLVQPSDYPNYPHIAPDNVEKGSGKLLEYRMIQEDRVTSPKHQFFPGQIIYSKIRPYLSKCVLVDFKGLCSADMYPIDSHICSEYLFYYILSDTFLDLIQKESGSRVVLPKANQKQVYAISVPVPPLDEQLAIVKKIKRLLLHKDCVKAAVKNQLENLEELQQSILAKAFQGELVPHDPNDEPASILLKRIRAERAKQETAAKTAKKSTGKTNGRRSRKAQQQDSEPIQLDFPGVE